MLELRTPSGVLFINDDPSQKTAETKQVDGSTDLKAAQMKVFDSVDGERYSDDVVRDPVTLIQVRSSDQ